MAAMDDRSARRSVANYFGDDTDLQPLWFKKDAFMDPNFSSESYIADLRRFVPLDTLKVQLRTHLTVLKNELVELINRDYNDFVNLSTKLVDVEGAVARMRTPLQELKVKLITVKDFVSESLSALQGALDRRAEATASREILELLLDTSHVISKIEKLLVELKNMPKDESQVLEDDGPNKRSFGNADDEEIGEQNITLEDSRSRMLERIASEMNRLKYCVARVQDLPFIRTMERRIQNAEDSLGDGLRKCFELGLERRDRTVLYHCLRAYAAIDNTSGAEAAFRETIVSPFIQKIIPSNSTKDVIGDTSDRLEEIFMEIEKYVKEDCKFLLDIAAAENSGLHVFDFLGNSILKEVHSTIQNRKPGAFSPGKPTEFLTNYKASLKFLSFLEGYCQSAATVIGFRLSGAYTEFLKLWNLGVYFTLRFQEIARFLDSAFTTSPLKGMRQNQSNLVLHPSITLWECLQRCWQDDVYISSLCDKFLRLSLQLVSRYITWVSTGLAAVQKSEDPQSGGEWALAAAPEDFLLVRYDIDLLCAKIKGPYKECVLEILAPTSSEMLLSIEQGILQGAKTLNDLVAGLMNILTEDLAKRCFEVLKQLKGITATYRMTNKPLPTRHSPYVTAVLQPLKSFLDGDYAVYLTTAAHNEVVLSVVEKVTTHYDELVRDLVTTIKKSETSLLRLRRQRIGTGPDSGDNSVSDTDKICAQLFLDIQEYGRRLAALGVEASQLTSYCSLWQFVAPQGRQSAIKFDLS